MRFLSSQKFHLVFVIGTLTSIFRNEGVTRNCKVSAYVCTMQVYACRLKRLPDPHCGFQYGIQLL